MGAGDKPLFGGLDEASRRGVCVTGNAWNRVHKLASRLGTDACEICGHQTGLNDCMAANEETALNASLDEAIQGLVNENTALTNENIDLKRQVDPTDRS